MKTRVAIVTNIIPHYRVDFYRRVFGSRKIYCDVYCHEKVAGSCLRSTHSEFAQNVLPVKYIGLAKEKFGWQRLPWRKLINDYDVIYIYGNPRILSNVILSLVLKVRCKPIVVCGQLRTAGTNRFTQKLRLLWWRIFDHYFLYTEAEANELRRTVNNKKQVVSMNNGLDNDAIDNAISLWGVKRLVSFRRTEGLENKRIIISCARLIPKNEFSLCIQALPVILRRFPDTIWVIIGSGPQAVSLRKLSDEYHVDAAIRWLGAIYDENEIAPWMLSSDLFIHPGAIGLSLMHAFRYGLPVITHDDPSYQMPEFRILDPGVNGAVFRHNDVRALANCIVAQLGIDIERTGMHQAAKSATGHYNTKVMATRFINMVASLKHAHAPKRVPHG